MAKYLLIDHSAAKIEKIESIFSIISHHIPPHLYVNPWILFWQLGPILGWFWCNKSTYRVNFDLQSFELEVEVSIWSTHYKLMGELSDILCCITQLITVLSSQKVRIARLNSIFKEKIWTWHWHWLRLFKSLDGFAFYFECGRGEYLHHGRFMLYVRGIHFNSRSRHKSWWSEALHSATLHPDLNTNLLATGRFFPSNTSLTFNFHNFDA